MRLAKVSNLVTARKTGCYQPVPWTHSLYCWQQSPICNGVRNFVVIPMVTKRTCHPATAGIKIDYSCRWNSREQREASGQQSHRFLVTVAVQKNAPIDRVERTFEARHKFLKRLTSACHDACFPLLFTAQKRESVFLHGGQTTRLAKHDFFTSLHNWEEMVNSF